ncbi:MAG: DUF5320 domain-containing protein [Patescibacteria group bacterium]
MPEFDRTGPQGAGPMTGKGLGPCGGGFGPMGWGFGRRRGAFGAGRGLGRYFGWNYSQPKKDQKKALADYRKALEEELEEVKKEEMQARK